MGNGQLAYCVSIAIEMVQFCIRAYFGAMAHSPRYPDRTHGFLVAAAVRPGDTADGHTNVRTAQIKYALGHFLNDGFMQCRAHCAKNPPVGRFIVCLATVVVIVRGHLAHRRGEIG